MKLTRPATRLPRFAGRREPRRRTAGMRYDRLTALVGALLILLVAMVGSLGASVPAAADPASGRLEVAVQPAVQVALRTRQAAERSAAARRLALPANSGHGRRAVFSQSRQRVWIVGADGKVRRTYLVSGSKFDNLHPGTYQVVDRQETAIGIDDSGEMRFFVVFTYGENAAIGFHSIPTLDGKPVQTRAQLGHPLSHGCIRQARPDARAMWRFAHLGTTVVVVA